MEHVRGAAVGDDVQQAGDRVVVAVVADDTPFCSTGPELLADLLFALGASAVSEVPGPDAGISLVADLPVRSLSGLEATGQPFEVLEVDPSWASGWQDHAVAVTAGDRLVVRPEWVERSPEHAGRIDVVVDAAESFGSGSHPTTQLCLAAVERIVTATPPRNVLDVGCGTGVLGVAALLLGAPSLVAIDIDPAAVVATRRTAMSNGVEDRLVESSDRTVDDVVAVHGPFDLVLANLLVPIIEELGAQLASAVAPGGHLVVSGLLTDQHLGQVDRAVAAVGGGFAVEQVSALDGWAAVVLVSS
jgi:ribosomal protein L11 methyltransferase